MRIMFALAAAAVVFSASVASAQTPSVVGEAIAAGQVGERYDGYMGVAAPVSAQVQRQVNAVNLRRRNLYIGLGERRKVTAEVVGLTAACELLRRLAPGEAYMLQDGIWRRSAVGQAARLPDYCR